MRNSAITIGSLAALCAAIYRSLDNYIVHNLVTASDSLTAAFAYLIIGSWTGVISGIVFSLVFGKLIDSDFLGIVIKNPEMQRQSFISGSISAGGTLFILLGNQIGDPSVIIALTNLIVIYTILHDILTQQATLQQLFIPSTLIITGGMMAAFNGSLAVTLLGFFYVVVVSNGLTAYAEIVEAKGVRASDSINLYIWRFFWLALTGTILAFTVSLGRGYLDLLWQTMQEAWVHLPWIIATMFFVFLGLVLKLYLKKTQAVSVVLLILSTQLFFAYPITIVGSWIQPGLFGDVPSSAVIWLVRFTGSIMIALGVIRFRKRKLSL
jgi:hypothetical protein